MNLPRAFSNKNIIFFIIVLGMTYAMAALSYYYREDIDIKRIPLIGKTSSHKPRNLSRCLLVTNVQAYDLRFQISVLCKDEKQKKKLDKMMPRIKHELIMSMNRPEVAATIKERKFEDFRSHLLEIFNKVSPKPIRELYFESFFCD